MEGMQKNTIDKENIDYKKIKNERDEYFELLRNWLDDARLWQNISTRAPSPAGTNQNSHLNSSRNFAQSYVWDQNFINNILRQRVPLGGYYTTLGNLQDIPLFATYPFNLTPNVRQPPTSYEFVIPPLWKRLVAEFIDFMILFSVKLALTFLLMESFNFINLDFYGFESFQKKLENPDIAYPMALEILTLEFLHRLVVCAFETYFLKGQLCATPGKRYMGLMVIKVNTLNLVPGRAIQTVTATGASPLGWQKSLLRSVLKTFIVGLLLPLCITFYIFPHNRTSYDMMTNTLVVESNSDFLMYHGLA
ncbi:protein FAM8A1 [Cylas formicarius]|uniref:protein FAM8A1 n=1 Tax=Cylas formicarius TaxID=197179 RepID=UPI002958B4BD|nr:protein FAM8A1 [Cylas formicarius]